MIFKTYQNYIIKFYLSMLFQVSLVFFGLILVLNIFEEMSYVKDLDINLNGIQGVDAILDMIKDTIDDGKTEDAKDWITQLQDELYDNGVRG